MKKLIALIFCSFFISNYVSATNSLISIESEFSSKETADRFTAILKNKGLTLFARIDHQHNATSVNLKLRETEVIIFGNPNVGTPLMQCSQEFAIDLPQKVLIWTDIENKVWISYNNPEYLKNRHNLEGCDELINKVSRVLKGLTGAAVSN
jgi:uncharacterized protein (DUF302 family)